jgi:phage baseplate assembly protein W
MEGVNAENGKALSGLEHLRQSIRDILTTPIGSRVMRRDYGSRLFELVDRPVNATWMADAYAYTAEALDRWEPRIQLDQVSISGITDEGWPVIDLYGTYLPDGSPVTLEGLL